MTSISLLQSWERAEIRRSSVEATLTGDETLRLDAAQLARYRTPSRDTAFPLEFCYHLLGPVEGLRILDIGCGSGANTLVLSGRGAHVCGVDVSADLIRLARRRLAVNGRPGGAEFVVGSAHDLPMPDNSIDIVFGIAILHHLDLELVSREVQRVLRPGGRAIFQEPCRNSRLVRFVRRLIPYRAPDISPFERPLTDPELDAFAAPFARARKRAFCLPPVRLAELTPGVRNHQRAIYETDAAALRFAPQLEYYAGVRVLEVTKG